MSEPLESPFPGFDPFLEDPAFWEDFHHSFITDLCRAILGSLPESYDARIDQRLRLVERDLDDDVERIIKRRPDVGIETTGRHATAGVAVLEETTIEPLVIPQMQLSEERDVWIEISHLPDLQLVTAIEVLSPSNKTPTGVIEYVARRDEYTTQHANVVKMDFLQGGQRPMYGSYMTNGDCFVTVTRAKPVRHVEIYGWPIDRKMPVVPIPLKSPDPDITVNLAKVFQTTYTSGRYRRRLRYAEFAPPVKSEREPWVRDMIKPR